MRTVLVLLATALILGVLFSRIPVREVASVLVRSRGWLLLVALGLTALFPVLSALRWQRILKLLDHPLGFGTAFSLIMAAWPVGAVTPSKSGDLVKAYYLKDRVPVSLTLGSVLAERALDVLVLLALSAAGAAVFGWTAVLWISGGLLAAGIAGLALLLATGERWPLPERWREKVARVLRAFHALLAHPASLALVLFYTAANWFLSILQTWVCFQAVRHPVSLSLTAGALPLAIFVGLLPFTLSGMGTRDAAMVALFARQAPPEAALGVGLLYTLLGYWIPAVAGLPFLRKAMPGRSAPRR
jgi:hypothetical protein